MLFSVSEDVGNTSEYKRDHTFIWFEKAEEILGGY